MLTVGGSESGGLVNVEGASASGTALNAAARPPRKKNVKRPEAPIPIIQLEEFRVGDEFCSNALQIREFGRVAGVLGIEGSHANQSSPLGQERVYLSPPPARRTALEGASWIAPTSNIGCGVDVRCWRGVRTMPPRARGAKKAAVKHQPPLSRPPPRRQRRPPACGGLNVLRVGRVNSIGGFSIFLAGKAAGFRPSTQGGKSRLRA